MRGMQKAGGIASLIEAGTFVFGFALLVTVLAPLFQGELDGVAMVRFLREYRGLYYLWNLVIYVLFGFMLIVLALALHERLRSTAGNLMAITTALGLLWAGLVIAAGMVANVGAAVVTELVVKEPTMAATVWVAVDTVLTGLGGGNEVVGGVWVLLLSRVALCNGKLPKALNYLGVVAGAAGVATLVPALTDLGALFGLGLIVWFVWVGVILLGDRES